jgi:hypothetical protein
VENTVCRPLLMTTWWSVTNAFRAGSTSLAGIVEDSPSVFFKK